MSGARPKAKGGSFCAIVTRLGVVVINPWQSSGKCPSHQKVSQPARGFLNQLRVGWGRNASRSIFPMSRRTRSILHNTAFAIPGRGSKSRQATCGDRQPQKAPNPCPGIRADPARSHTLARTQVSFRIASCRPQFPSNTHSEHHLDRRLAYQIDADVNGR